MELFPDKELPMNEFSAVSTEELAQVQGGWDFLDTIGVVATVVCPVFGVGFIIGERAVKAAS
jgi:bacteriocin-like protein